MIIILGRRDENRYFIYQSIIQLTEDLSVLQIDDIMSPLCSRDCTDYISHSWRNKDWQIYKNL